ncbi:serine threonine protein kinase [Leptolyngbya sp. Heron Island J]|uniref:serine/threonine protein kinase n=1 Tax=Leptolyngbya sp. Heron Island J TaxID=1385935 RepID=UPI0003B9EA74|nr:serine/threonine-protein kinase [Leptolyngbya sp. Heron Island J]ESA38082.1 serine threonine protein kinase [Leptolyngbya sp. Heron Island J]
MASPRVLQTAPRLRNRYSIQQNLGARLGRRTLLGYDHSCNNWVVIKYLCFDDPIQTTDVARFHKETAVLKVLDHPAIPSYCDSFEINHHGYRGLMLVQNYIEGQSLYALLNPRRVFTESEVRQLACQILEILDYLHTQHPTIIHRDIKPSSFVLSPYGNLPLGKIYLVDFGLVQHSDDTEHTADLPILISGTPGYRPPEQLGDRAVPASDLYSLGATLVHLATGQHPHTLPQRGLRMLFCQELGHMSRPFKSWLRWLTQPQQHKRPVSAKAALNGLEQADKIFASTHCRFPRLPGQHFQQTSSKTTIPANAQFKIFEYSQTLEMLFPPLGWKNKAFCLGLLQTVIGAAGVALVFQNLPDLWLQLTDFAQRLLTIMISLGWIQLSLCCAQRGLKTMLTTVFQQVSIQLLPDIMLLGYRFPCRPVDYQINTYKQDIEDIDLQPGSSTITFRLRQNRTTVGTLEHKLAAQDLGVSQTDISWINDILQLWLVQSPRSLA